MGGARRVRGMKKGRRGGERKEEGGKGRKDKSVATLTTKHCVRYVRVVLLATRGS